MRAVILAGGEGSRLRPYTTILPKPLMPVGHLPIAEIIVRQLKHFGVKRITFAVGYLSHLLEAYFGAGTRWDIMIDYLHEDTPRGTAGPLAHIDDFDEPLLVLNGDILTDLDFSDLYRYHLDSSNTLTIASYSKKVNIDLGVIQSASGGQVTDYIEKPSYSHEVSMGIYVFSPAVRTFIPSGERFDFPELVKALIRRDEKVQTYHFDGIWLDIGRREDYLKAAEVFEQHQQALLPDKQLTTPGTRAITQAGRL